MKKILTLIHPVSLLIGLFTILLFYSCEQEEPAGGFVYLSFDHTAGGLDLKLNDTWYDCLAGHFLQVIRLKYYVSNFELYNTEGESVEIRQVHYRDVEDPNTRVFEWRDVPPGEYTSLSFIFGLDEMVNVDGGLPNTTTNINMEWPLPGDQGYHYMKFEGRYDRSGAGEVKPFNLHTGPTGNNQNYVRISLPFQHPVKISSGVWQISLKMDLLEWLQNPHVYDFEAFGPMIMANQEAQQLLRENGASVFSINGIEQE